MELFLAAWSCCFILYKQMSSFLSIHFKSRYVIQIIVQLLGLYFIGLIFCIFVSPFFGLFRHFARGGIAPHLVPLIWLVILALHLDHSPAKLTATCVLPRNNPKQIQTNPCAIKTYWSTTVQDFALKNRIFSAIS